MKYLKRGIVVCCVVLLTLASLTAQTTPIASNAFEFMIHSKVLNEDRSCLIQLPENYYASENDEAYPVLILLDGAVFFKTTAGVVHFMSSARNRNYFMPETIIVAIENVDRERDFTVTKIKTKRKNTMGGGWSFLEFIEKELVPYVDENYRTIDERTLVGHSLGGLLAVNAYIDENSIFNSFLAIDPSIWWDEQMMNDKVAAVTPASFRKKLYIASANRGEGNNGKNKGRHDTFYALLNRKSVEPLQAEIDYFESEDHRSVPLVALYEGLRFLNNDAN
ncbi:alpha/beta hydrolase [Lutimonas sp.]|uniref:alpha/beta hydrolase n=1 Tax=Lutimonas sp. TaxID=1872403 RepID=UPI003D9B455D